MVIDSITGKPIEEGFFINGGAFYCESEEHALIEIKKAGYSNLEESYNDGYHYWTVFED